MNIYCSQAYVSTAMKIAEFTHTEKRVPQTESYKYQKI